MELGKLRKTSDMIRKHELLPKIHRKPSEKIKLFKPPPKDSSGWRSWSDVYTYRHLSCCWCYVAYNPECPRRF